MTTDAKQSKNAEAATLTLGAAQLRGVKRPVIHVLTASGRMDEFKDRGVVIPDCSVGVGDHGVTIPQTHVDPADEVVLALLINGKGEPFYTADGQLAVVNIPVVGLDGRMPNPDHWLDWREMAERAGVALSTAKRMVEEGELPKPVKLGKRRVGFKQGEVDEAVARLGQKR